MHIGKKKIQISNKLPQFEKTRALFIVTGRQEASFFVAYNGTFSLIDFFVILHPKYTDKEGHFMVRGGGRTYGQGSVYETPKEEIMQKFLKSFKESLVKILAKKNFDVVYLFSPVAKTILEEIPKKTQAKIKKIIKKDYSHEHQFKLLEAVK